MNKNKYLEILPIWNNKFFSKYGEYSTINFHNKGDFFSPIIFKDNKRNKEYPDFTDLLFVDYDFKEGKSLKNGKKLEHLQSICENNKIPPYCIVDSGHGYQLYWKLKDRFYFNNVNKNKYKIILQYLCSIFNGDPGATLLTQLLRIPGTMNTKEKNKPILCEMVYENINAEIDIKIFDKILLTYKKENTKTKRKTNRYKLRNIIKKIEKKNKNNKQRILEDILSINQKVGWRSSLDYSIAKRMLFLGFSKQSIKDVLTNRDKAISLNNLGEKYVNLTINNAYKQFKNQINFKFIINNNLSLSINKENFANYAHISTVTLKKWLMAFQENNLFKIIRKPYCLVLEQINPLKNGLPLTKDQKIFYTKFFKDYKREIEKNAKKIAL